MPSSKVMIRSPSAFDEHILRESQHGLTRWYRRAVRRTCLGCRPTVAFLALAVAICGSLAILSHTRWTNLEHVPNRILDFIPLSRFHGAPQFMSMTSHPGWALATTSPQPILSISPTSSPKIPIPSLGIENPKYSSTKNPYPSSTKGQPSPSMTHPAVITAHQRVDEFLAFQSKTLPQARSRYTLKTGRDPPPHYDTFFQWATEHQCLIDAYDQVYADFQPWYQMSKINPRIFIERLARAWDITAKSNQSHMQAFSVQGNGSVKPVGHFIMPYKEEWMRILSTLPLPFINLIANAQDEPRIVFNTRLPDSRSLAMSLNDPQRSPFMRDNYRGTERYYGLAPEGEEHCLMPNTKEGFGDLVNDKHAFLLSTAMTGFTTDMYPILSMTKIEPCFADIISPTTYNYARSNEWATRYRWPNNVRWEDKANVAYWRGSTSGGYIYGTNYRSFQRFRLIEIARQHPSLFDVALTEIGWWWGCGPECDLEQIVKDYDIRPNQTSMETLYGYKFAIDVDGNSFSARFLGLLSSGSLVFKSTIFTEHHSRWLKAYEHYIPILPDLSDLPEKIQWAIDNDDEARLIQETGKAMVERVVARDEQNDCYWFAVLLEYSQLQNMGL